jgi:hypothetical protein
MVMGIDDLLGGPRCRRRIRNMEMNDLAPSLTHDHQHVKQTSEKTTIP